MTRITKIEDRHPLTMVMPIRITERVWRKPRQLIRCGCCSERLEVYTGEPTNDPHADTLEINGVMGTVDQWRQILLPLLQMEVPELVANSANN